MEVQEDVRYLTKEGPQMPEERVANLSAKIETRGLKASFGSNMVLKGIDLRIPENRITAVMGPSGCGKTTFVRCLNRLHELIPGATVEGEALLDGENVYARDVDPVRVRRRIGMVFQKPNPFPTMSIFQNAVAGLTLNGVKDKKTLQRAAEESLREAYLWDEVKEKLDNSGASLSGGQQQRLCIARALAVEPEVLLMDEPCSALDPTATAKIEELMTNLKREYTIIIVTHNMQQASRVADYTAFFYLGKLVEFDETATLFENPREELTERYITGKFG
ncbi:MAG TPA: phosphate ABC transporter ATP-binding protein PstB [Nitrososphaerales archaeon]|nr:phosphate ABC transporter ATP-binding protein PstB [Nitrososphaerales archaeon]